LGESDHSIIRTDVLIIGGGGAGMRAAIEAASRGCARSRFESGFGKRCGKPAGSRGRRKP
jgi:succinate dehydrogenase/fumarate reductase flavoprotein subunit